jgi:hypothetical protein
MSRCENKIEGTSEVEEWFHDENIVDQLRFKFDGEVRWCRCPA